MWECLIKALDDSLIFNISKQKIFINIRKPRHK